MGRLEDRLAGDFESARDRLTSSLPGTEKLDGAVSSHPLSAIAAAFAAGIVLGMVSDRPEEDPPAPPRRRERGGLAALFGSLAGPVEETLGGEVRNYVRQAAAGFAGQQEYQSGGDRRQRRAAAPGNGLGANREDGA
jgi:hypothetical protein